MRVLHINEQHDLEKSGVSTAANSVMRQIIEGGGAAYLLAVGPIELTVPGIPHESIPVAASAAGPRWRWGENMPARMRTSIAAFDPSVVHLHGIWMAPQVVGARAAAAAGRPTVLTNHGMLEPWALAQPGRLGALKKRAYLSTVARWGLRDLSVLHAITPLERDQLASLFPRHRIEVIPNSVDLDALRAGPRPTDLPDDYILFVGRLHPKKGVDLLIDAFLAARLPSRVELLIAGPPDDAGYAAAMRQKADRSGRRVTFLGPVWDDAVKLAMMQHARLVAVPSHSEVVALVNLEAAAVSTPTLTTRETGLLDWEEGGGLLVERDAGAIAAMLEQACGWSDAERADRGAASHRHVTARYSTAATRPMWINLYRDLARS